MNRRPQRRSRAGEAVAQPQRPAVNREPGCWCVGLRPWISGADPTALHIAKILDGRFFAKQPDRTLLLRRVIEGEWSSTATHTLVQLVDREVGLIARRPMCDNHPQRGGHLDTFPDNEWGLQALLLALDSSGAEYCVTTFEHVRVISDGRYQLLFGEPAGRA